MTEILDTYIEYQGYDPETFELHENIIFVSDGRRLLAQDVPYSLYEVEGMVFGYELFKTEFCRIDISSEVLWCFPLRRIDDEGCDRGADHLDKVLGIAQRHDLDLHRLGVAHRPKRRNGRTYVSIYSCQCR